MDHPIELEKWNIVSHRLGFSDMKGYFGTHPKRRNINVCKEAIAKISVEYSTLSQAVHGSAKSFRMTDDVSTTLLWRTDPAKISQWSTREKAVLQPIFVIIVCLFSRSEENTSELQSLLRISYAVFFLKTTNTHSFNT